MQFPAQVTPSASSSTPRPTAHSLGRHYPELDGVRGIAVLTILLFHFSLSAPQGRVQSLLTLGWCGVDLFFVLSGFLITGILLDTRDSPAYLKRFYGRRARRIAPLYYTTLLLIIGASFLLGAHAPWQRLTPLSYPWFFLPLGNVPGAFGFFVGEPAGHFWSLAIEEQFYFIWPLVVRAPRGSGKTGQ